MKILSVCPMDRVINTCLHRHNILTKLANGIDAVNTAEKSNSIWYRIANKLFSYGLPIRLPDSSGANKKMKEFVFRNKYDIVWIDKGLTINKETLLLIKEKSPETKIVNYGTDNMALRHNQSQNYLECIPLYDFHFIPRRPHISDTMRHLGAKKVILLNKSFESSFHYPRNLTTAEKQKFGDDVGFIGSWEKERCDSVLYLVEHGIKVKVFGDNKWQKYKHYHINLKVDTGLYSEDYAKALHAFKISLCFLRKINFDQQTSRTMEIPACGGFMLAERTQEHLSLFEEGKEAEFFSSNEELLQKCKYYLEHEEERKTIAQAGLLRCKTSGYSNKDTVKKMIQICMSRE